MTRKAALSQSHQLLGTLLQLSLTPVQISVNIEVDLLSESPKADILLMRREGETWSASQRARLPDGVRDSAAGHVLLEFKYTESVNETVLAQAGAYDHFYRQAQKLPAEQALTVALSATDAAAGTLGVHRGAAGCLPQPSPSVAARAAAGVERPAIPTPQRLAGRATGRHERCRTPDAPAIAARGCGHCRRGRSEQERGRYLTCGIVDKGLLHTERYVRLQHTLVACRQLYSESLADHLVGLTGI